MPTVYRLVHSRFMDCFTFLTTSDFVGQSGRRGLFGWHDTVAIFKLVYDLVFILRRTSITVFFKRLIWMLSSIIMVLKM